MISLFNNYTPEETSLWNLLIRQMLFDIYFLFYFMYWSPMNPDVNKVSFRMESRYLCYNSSKLYHRSTADGLLVARRFTSQ